MECLKTKNRKNFFYWTPDNPLNVFFAFILFCLLFIPNYIWVSIKSLTPKEKDVRGQVVLITGAARGLGRELALTFHRLGAQLVCVDVNEEGNNKTAEMIREEGGTVRAFTLDITDRAKIKLMHENVKNELGPVDILVNNAAVVQGNIYVNPKSDELVRNIINVNLLGQFWMNKEILPSMLDRNRGHIVAISSLISMVGCHSLSAYAASKWGVTGMMESLEKELKMMKSDVITTTVCPYFVDSNKAITRSTNLSFPVIPLDVTTNKIVNGILKKKVFFTVPNYYFLAAMFYKILPIKLQYYVQNKIGGLNKYSKTDYETLKKYQRK